MAIKYPQKAKDAEYNNQASGLAARNVQDAIDEVAGNDWVAWTPTGTFTTNTTYTGVYRVSNGMLSMQVRLVFAGAPNTATCYVNLPTGWTIDSAILPTWDPQLGGGAMRDSSASISYQIYIMPHGNDLTQVHPTCFNAATTYAYHRGVTQAAPIATIANTDYLTFFATMPVVRV